MGLLQHVATFYLCGSYFEQPDCALYPVAVFNGASCVWLKDGWDLALVQIWL